MSGRTAFVTGGSGDLGEAIVTALARSGHRVWFQYNAGTERAERLQRLPGVTAFRCDYASVDGADAARLVPPDVDVDVLVCSSGVSPEPRPLAEVSAESLRTTLEVNLLSAFRVTQACLPAMVASGWGRVVYVGSVFGQVAGECNSAYNVSKYALTGLCHSVVADHPGSGVTANVVAPGPVDSSMLGRIARRRGADPAEFGQRLARRTPGRRLVRPDDVAGAVTFLVSDAAAYVSGCTLTVDGGLLCVR